MNAVVLLSGGLDSQVLLASERPNYKYVHCVGFRYGQRHVRELQHAYQIAHYYGATFEAIELPRLKGSALTGDGELPKGIAFDDERQSVTVVPNRNAIMLSLAASVAVTLWDRSEVLFAAHAGDAAIYRDCREDFVAAMSRAFMLSCGIRIIAPFLRLEKNQIAARGKDLRVPMEMSWSCYEGGERPCGQCGACVERVEALS